MMRGWHKGKHGGVCATEPAQRQLMLCGKYNIEYSSFHTCKQSNGLEQTNQRKGHMYLCNTYQTYIDDAIVHILIRISRHSTYQIKHSPQIPHRPHCQTDSGVWSHVDWCLQIGGYSTMKVESKISPAVSSVSFRPRFPVSGVEALDESEGDLDVT